MRLYGKQRFIPSNRQRHWNEAEINLLHRAIIDVLARAVEAGGTTIRTYLNALGEAGHFQVSTRLWSNRQSLCPLWYPGS